MARKEENYYDSCEVHLPTCYADGLVPLGRGVPADLLETGADCGPSSLAAYLNISTAESIKLLPLWRRSRKHSSKRALAALLQVGKPHKRINLPAGTKSLEKIRPIYPAGLCEIRFVRPDGKDFFLRHIVAYDKNISGKSLVYDNNVFFENEVGYGRWIPEEQWRDLLLNRSNGWSRSKVHLQDYYLSHVLVPLN
jgi:hypothetical protein